MAIIFATILFQKVIEVAQNDPIGCRRICKGPLDDPAYTQRLLLTNGPGLMAPAMHGFEVAHKKCKRRTANREIELKTIAAKQAG